MGVECLAGSFTTGKVKKKDEKDKKKGKRGVDGL